MAQELDLNGPCLLCGSEKREPVGTRVALAFVAVLLLAVGVVYYQKFAHDRAIDLFFNKSAHGYAAGEPATIMVKAKRDVCAYIFLVMPAGNMYLLYPEKPGQNAIQPGETKIIDKVRNSCMLVDRGHAQKIMAIAVDANNERAVGLADQFLPRKKLCGEMNWGPIEVDEVRVMNTINQIERLEGSALEKQIADAPCAVN